jgi:hypothetical protein
VGSFPGFVFSFNSLSSAESEFIATVRAAQTTRYLCFVLGELGSTQSGPTLLLVDNKDTIYMINVNWPTPHARHIDTQYFTIQE